ncbi:CinA family nicotinamide mononucleotide deamidase-related protein [Euzebya tangerina]|uniref:CinA family nicotinamide mononucleotide deamidase-related protein n=1 Tax=Euzebya tangerina TaxID=591198 RepID=UPI0013C2B1B1|nr:CinA family nicotinamide mononucleotide deamidase-related protein [Euzebya tangerina]
MRAHIIAIGNELLLGDNTDTNSAWISRRLAEIGIEVVRHTSVSDGIDDMREVISSAVASADVVLTTGGLGPTQDDLTKVALAQVGGVSSHLDEAMADEIAAYFASRGYEMTANNLQQAELPEGAWWLTRVGTAPGVGMEVGEAVVFCMPGVPREMKEMMDQDVIPDLVRRADAAVTVTRIVRTSGIGEATVAATLADLAEEIERDGQVTLAFLASRGETRVKLTATAGTREAASAMVVPLADRAAGLLGEAAIGFDDEGVEFDIGRRLVAAEMTVAVAESMTGGGVGTRLVTVPGASNWFRGGLITYATATKVSLAGLDGARVEREGPVSEWTARSLAAAAADRLGADLGLSIVGVAGPDPQGGQPVGTIWIGTAGPDGLARAKAITVPGRGRTDVQEFGVAVALNALHRFVRRLTAG